LTVGEQNHRTHGFKIVGFFVGKIKKENVHDIVLVEHIIKVGFY